MAPPDVVITHSHPESAQGPLHFTVDDLDNGGRMVTAAVWVETLPPGAAADAVLEPAMLVHIMDGHEPARLMVLAATDGPKKRYAEFYSGCMTVTDIRRVESTPLPDPLPPPEEPGQPPVVRVPPPASRIRLQPCPAGVLAKLERVDAEFRAARNDKLALRSEAVRSALDINEQLAKSAATCAAVTIAAPAWWHQHDLVDLMVAVADSARDTLRPYYAPAALAASQDPDLGGRPIEPGPPGDPNVARGGVGLALWRAEALLQDETGSPAVAAAHRRMVLADRARAAGSRTAVKSPALRADALAGRPMAIDAATAAMVVRVKMGRATIRGLPPSRLPPVAVVEEEAAAPAAYPPQTADQVAAAAAHTDRAAQGTSDGAAYVVTTSAGPAERPKVAGKKKKKKGGK